MQNFFSFLVYISQRMPHLRLQHFNVHFRNIAKNTYHYFMFVRPSACINSAYCGWICLKFDIGDFC
jgi:hypothetical protein